MKNKRLALFTDGASRGNPGPSGIGVVIREGRKKVGELYKYIGETTNNAAEYHALIHGLKAAVDLKADEVVVNIDSELVVRQLNGEYKVKDAGMKELFARSLAILSGFKNFKIQHIDRSENKEADRLANKAINLSNLFYT